LISPIRISQHRAEPVRIATGCPPVVRGDDGNRKFGG